MGEFMAGRHLVASAFSDNLENKFKGRQLGEWFKIDNWPKNIDKVVILSNFQNCRPYIQERYAHNPRPQTTILPLFP